VRSLLLFLVSVTPFYFSNLIAQSPIAIRIDPSAERRPISPDIYGINEYEEFRLGREESVLGAYPVTTRRWGGDTSTRYNWKLDAHNTAGNWFFENFRYEHRPNEPINEAELPKNSGFDKWVMRAQRFGIKSVASVPIIGWTTKNRSDKTCSFSVAKYGQQQSTDVWAPDCGNGIKPDGRTRITSDPNDTSMPVDESFAEDWVKHVSQRFGTTAEGGVFLWELDNEPIWWWAQHRDIHPDPVTFDETLERGVRYARAIKRADPSAKVGGPIPAGWESLFFSTKDMLSGWNTGPDYKYWNNPIDKKAHEDLPFVAWYLREMKRYEERTGQRLLDYFDAHAYVGPDGLSFANREASKDQLRLQSTRVFWDPNYMPPREDMQAMRMTPQMVRRMRQWVDEFYPGTKIAITEYNWGAFDHITGAIAQADILGIFGREGVDLATVWGNPKPTEPARFAFKMFLDYDGRGNRFGETSVSATTSDVEKMTVYAAQRSDRAITVLLLNKSDQNQRAALDLRNFAVGGTAQVWRYTQAGLQNIVADSGLSVNNGAASVEMPGYSMALLVIPAEHNRTVPKIEAITSGASFTRGKIAPGQMLSIFGSDLGPADPVVFPALASRDFLAAQLADVRVLFDGQPAIVLAATKGQINVVAPYSLWQRSVTSVQVEYQGVRSATLDVQVDPTAPGVFTTDGSGRGNAAAINYLPGNLTETNGPNRAAARGSVVALFLTGEGETDPPSIDGRLANRLLTKPVRQVRVTIGGREATVEYCGSAPATVAGLMQINVRVPNDVAAGAAALEVSVGGVRSQDGVTLSVR
jgi:uncharacterized protein (TIGR03437 family)